MTLKDAWQILREAGKGWMKDRAPEMSAALAFYTILSVTPLLLIATAIAGAVFGREAASGALSEQLQSLVGDAGAEVIRGAVERADRPHAGIIATVIGVVTLLVGASGVFGQLQQSLNGIWNVKPRPGRGFWGTIKDRLLSFGMVLVVGFLLLVSLVVTTMIEAMAGYFTELLPGLPALMQLGNFVIGFLIITVLFALIFKYLPDARIAWRDVWFGAAVTAALFTVGKYLIGLYIGRAGVGTPFGVAGSLVAFLVWVYYSGLIMLFGAELTQVVARFAGRQIEPTANAEFADGLPHPTPGMARAS